MKILQFPRQFSGLVPGLAACLFLAGCVADFETVDVADVSIVDGDTIRILDVTHRLVGFDTPEIFSPSCERELVLGRMAKQRLEQLVFSQSEIQIASQGAPDRYGRTLSVLVVAGVDVSDVLVDEGFARRYSGGRRLVWC